jgi:molybdenum cofactor cytidylyltransferase
MTNAGARIVGVLLAAGRGARFDPHGRRLKLLEPATRGPHRGEPLAVAAARTLLSAVDEVLAVVAPAADARHERLRRLLATEGCTTFENAQADEGQGTSIACGVAATGPVAGWVIALADMPAIATATVLAVAECLRSGAVTVAPAYRGQRGHPVGFAAALRQELLALSGDTGAREVLVRHPPRLIEVDDPGVLYDVDVSEDLV